MLVTGEDTVMTAEERRPCLRDDDVGHRLRVRVQLLGLDEAQRLHVVLQVVLDAVVDVWDLADVVLAALHPEVLRQLAPAADYQLPRLAVVQLHL